MLKKGAAGHTKTCGLAAVTFPEGTDLDAVIKAVDGKDLYGR